MKRSRHPDLCQRHPPAQKSQEGPCIVPCRQLSRTWLSPGGPPVDDLRLPHRRGLHTVVRKGARSQRVGSNPPADHENNRGLSPRRTSYFSASSIAARMSRLFRSMRSFSLSFWPRISRKSSFASTLLLAFLGPGLSLCASAHAETLTFNCEDRSLGKTSNLALVYDGGSSGTFKIKGSYGEMALPANRRFEATRAGRK